MQEKVIPMHKKPLFLVLLYLGPLLSLQTRTKLRNSVKGILNGCKLQITIRFKDRNPK